jgi:hypothetical protein
LAESILFFVFDSLHLFQNISQPLSLTLTSLSALPGTSSCKEKWREKVRMYLLQSDAVPEFVSHFNVTGSVQTMLEKIVNSFSLAEMGWMCIDMKQALFSSNLATIWHPIWRRYKSAKRAGCLTVETLLHGFLFDTNAVLLVLKDVNERVRQEALASFSDLYSDEEVTRFTAANVRQKNTLVCSSLHRMANDVLLGLRLQHLQRIGRAMDYRQVLSSAERDDELLDWLKDSELFGIQPAGYLYVTRDAMAMGNPSLQAMQVRQVVDFFNAINDPFLPVDNENVIASLFECDFWTNEDTPRAAEILSAMSTYNLHHYYLPLRAFRLRNMSVDKIIDFLQAGEFEPPVDLPVLLHKVKAITEHSEFHSLSEELQTLFMDLLKHQNHLEEMHESPFQKARKKKKRRLAEREAKWTQQEQQKRNLGISDSKGRIGEDVAPSADATNNQRTKKVPGRSFFVRPRFVLILSSLLLI